MNESESFEDTITTGERLLEAGCVFSRASLRAFQLLGSITNARRAIGKTMPFGQQALEKEHFDFVIAFLEDNETSKIFKNPEEMRQEHNIRALATQVTVQSIA